MRGSAVHDGAGGSVSGRFGAPPRRTPLTTTELAFGLAAVGSALLKPPFSLPGGLALVDILFALIIAGGLIRLVSSTRTGKLFHRFVPWLFLYLIGQIIGLLGVGFTGWGLSGLARNGAPVLLFVLLVVRLASRPASLSRCDRMVAAAGCIVAASVISDGGSRAAGTFDNPNYAAHFLCVAAIVIGLSNIRTWAKLAMFLLFGVALIKTGSFSTFPLIGTSLGYASLGKARALPVGLRLVARLILIAGFSAMVVLTLQYAANSHYDAGSGLNSQRFDRSSSTREHVWRASFGLFEQHPLGIGPNGIVKRGYSDEIGAGEAHNDVLDALVAGGVLSALGLVGIVCTIWRLGKPGSRLRILLAGLVAASLVRQTWNFRHIWVSLALVAAYSLAERRQAEHEQLERAAGVC